VEKSLPAPNPANRPPRGDKNEEIEHKHRFFSQLKTAPFQVQSAISPWVFDLFWISNPGFPQAFPQKL
jgi:hypothetical protein